MKKQGSIFKNTGKAGIVMAKTNETKGLKAKNACQHCGGETLTFDYKTGVVDTSCLLCGEIRKEMVMKDESGQVIYEADETTPKIEVTYRNGYGTAYLKFANEGPKYGVRHHFTSKKHALKCLKRYESMSDRLVASESYFYLFDKETGTGTFLHGSLPSQD